MTQQTAEDQDGQGQEKGNVGPDTEPLPVSDQAVLAVGCEAEAHSR